MDLFLVQHGEAKSEAEDPERSLTDRGAEAVRRMAAWAAQVGVKVDQIRHSGMSGRWPRGSTPRSGRSCWSGTCRS
jgi:phosphohistidine phosphatase SixA